MTEESIYDDFLKAGVMPQTQADIIEDALAHFCHKECPYCGGSISLEYYIDQKDIQMWLQERSEEWI